MSTCNCAVHVTIFSSSLTGFKFTELHILTLVACSYALLVGLISKLGKDIPHTHHTHLFVVINTVVLLIYSVSCHI